MCDVFCSLQVLKYLTLDTKISNFRFQISEAALADGGVEPALFAENGAKILLY